MPDGAVYVGRPTFYGNPYRAGDTCEVTGEPITAEQAVKRFRLLWRQTAFADVFNPKLEAIRGKDLACWCAIGSPCHADVLLELANR